jgi:putative phosphoribosyl transferase
MTREVAIPAGSVVLPGTLAAPNEPLGVVAFAHGSGSSRFSPRNTFVAEYLQHCRLATLLLDLLTPREDSDPRNRFHITLLAGRLRAAVDWLCHDDDAAALPIGLFGASTGAAAALYCAANLPDRIHAVVSRGGRPDLAAPALRYVRAPTLLIVGGDDIPVVGMNEEAYAQLDCVKRLAIIPGATHLFEEPGALEQVARLASDWFLSPGAANRAKVRQFAHPRAS